MYLLVSGLNPQHSVLSTCNLAAFLKANFYSPGKWQLLRQVDQPAGQRSVTSVLRFLPARQRCVTAAHQPWPGFSLDWQRSQGQGPSPEIRSKASMRWITCQFCWNPLELCVCVCVCVCVCMCVCVCVCSSNHLDYSENLSLNIALPFLCTTNIPLKINQVWTKTNDELCNEYTESI